VTDRLVGIPSSSWVGQDLLDRLRGIGSELEVAEDFRSARGSQVARVDGDYSPPGGEVRTRLIGCGWGRSSRPG
jgi:hypothetical protein